MIDAARIADVLHAEQAFRISALFHVLCSCDRFRIFLRFGEVYRDIEIPILCLCDPLQIFTDAVTADIVGILAQFIEITGRILRGLFIFTVELFYDLTRARHQAVHEPRIKEIPVHNAVVFKDPVFCRVIGQLI